MIFKFQLYNVQVSTLTWLKLQKQVLILYVKRILRAIKRFVLYLKSYVPTILCIIVFECLIIPLGIKIHKYETWLDGIWDLRVFFLTTLIISIFVSVLNEEKKRHNELVSQYNTYEKFKYDSNFFITSLCKLSNMHYENDLFLCENNFDSFYKFLSEFSSSINPDCIGINCIYEEHLLYSTKEIPRFTFIKIQISRYYRSLKNYEQSLLAHNYVGSISHALDQINYIYDEIEAEQILIDELQEKYTDSQLLKFINCISRCIYPAIADIRRPWRWDINVNQKIETLINKRDIGR